MKKRNIALGGVVLALTALTLMSSAFPIKPDASAAMASLEGGAAQAGEYEADYVPNEIPLELKGFSRYISGRLYLESVSFDTVYYEDDIYRYMLPKDGQSLGIWLKDDNAPHVNVFGRIANEGQAINIATQLVKSVTPSIYSGQVSVACSAGTDGYKVAFNQTLGDQERNLVVILNCDGSLDSFGMYESVPLDSR